MRNISLWLFEELVEENKKNHNYTAVDLDKHSAHNSLVKTEQKNPLG